MPRSAQDVDMEKKLDSRSALEEYDEKGRQIEAYEREKDGLIKEMQACPVRSLSRWDRFVNRARLFFKRPESKKVKQFKEYEAIKAKKEKCDAAIKSASIRRADIESTYEDAFKQRDQERAEKERLKKLDDVAKKVVRITKEMEAKLADKPVPVLSDDELNKQAEILKGKDYFKEAIAELDAENSTVEPSFIVKKLTEKIVAEVEDKTGKQKKSDEARGMNNPDVDAEQTKNHKADAEQKTNSVVNKENGIVM